MTVQTSPQPEDGALANHAPLDANRWGLLFPADAVTDDFSGGTWQVRATGANRVVTVGAVGDRIVVRGHLGLITAAESIDFAAIAGGPSSVQERYTRVVARFHRSGPLLTTITVEALVGSSASIGQGAIPARVRSAVAWDMSLGVVREQGTTALSQSSITDTRAWNGQTLYIPDGLPDGDIPPQPLGTILHRGTTWQKRVMSGPAGNQVPAWEYSGQKTDFPLNLGSGVSTGAGSERARTERIDTAPVVLTGTLTAPAAGYTGGTPLGNINSGHRDSTGIRHRFLAWERDAARVRPMEIQASWNVVCLQPLPAGAVLHFEHSFYP